MTRKAFSAANIILQHFIDKDDPIRNMKLQKLLYFACGWHLAYFEDWLIEDDDFYAWPYGPVCTNLYRTVSEWGSDPIDTKINVDSEISFTSEEKEIINNVIDSYGDSTDWQLSNITHKQGTPWSETINKQYVGALIERELMKNFYKKVMKENKSD